MKYRFMVIPAAALVLSWFGPSGGRAPAAERPAVEIGTVRWERDFDGALQKSGESGRPVLLLFQEVPGCAGCK